MELAEAARTSATPPDGAWRPTHLPRLIVCAWNDEGVDTAATLAARGWRHDRAEVVHAVLPAEPSEAFAALLAVMREQDASGVLIVEASGRGVRVPLGAGNRRARSEGGVSASGRERRIAPVGPGSARVTAPVAEMLRAIVAERTSAAVVAEASDRRGNHLIYRLLTEAAAGAGAPTVGALLLPATAEPDGAESDGAASDGAGNARALCAAVLAFAETLAPAVVARA